VRAPLLVAFLLACCGGRVDDTNPHEAGVDLGPPIDDPATCSSTANVATCASGCMATATGGGDVRHMRIGRLRVVAPDSLLALTPVWIDPHVSARCFNGGTEALSVLLSFDLTTRRLVVGSARPSVDGAFRFASEAVETDARCPRSAGASIAVAPIALGLAVSARGFRTELAPSLALAIFNSTGSDVLPLRDVSLSGTFSSASCIGQWGARTWCDGTTLGWTDTPGLLQAKILADEADRVFIREAGCQTLCAILVNDATKVVDKHCKRNVDGSMPELGDTCVGGVTCRNAFRLAARFGAYAVEITP
jgi:hypothetical protein